MVDYNTNELLEKTNLEREKVYFDEQNQLTPQFRTVAREHMAEAQAGASCFPCEKGMRNRRRLGPHSSLPVLALSDLRSSTWLTLCWPIASSSASHTWSLGEHLRSIVFTLISIGELG